MQGTKQEMWIENADMGKDIGTQVTVTGHEGWEWKNSFNPQWQRNDKQEQVVTGPQTKQMSVIRAVKKGRARKRHAGRRKTGITQRK